MSMHNYATCTTHLNTVVDPVCFYFQLTINEASFLQEQKDENDTLKLKGTFLSKNSKTLKQGRNQCVLTDSTHN